MLVYGQTGSGKTTLWSSFPGPILALICSGGTNPDELRSIDTPANRKKITPVVINDSNDVEEVLADTSEYETVVLDHTSSYRDLIIKESLGLDKMPLQLFKESKKGETWGLVEQRQWGQINLKLKETFYAMLETNCHCVIVAQEREFNTDEAAGVLNPYVSADLTPGASRWLRPACSYVCQTFIRQATEKKKMKIGKKVIERESLVPNKFEFCLRIGTNPVYVTRFRRPIERGELPECIVNPTYDKIVEVIEG